MGSDQDNVHAQPKPLRVVVRPVGDALPLAFFSFGIGMLLLSGISLQWIGGPEVRTAGILLAAFVFPLEFLSCVFAFLSRDGATAATLGFFSTSWLALGLVDIVSPSAMRSPAVGLYLIGFAVMILLIASVTVIGKPLLAAVLFASALRAILAGATAFGAPQGLGVAAGIVAIAIFLGAAYLGLAFVLEDTRQRPVLPTFRRGAAAAVFSGEVNDEFGRIQQEAGVRSQL